MPIRRLTADDSPQYRRLMLEAYEHAADAFTSTAAERAAEPDSWWIRRIADPTQMSVGFGAFDGGQLVGAVAVEFSAKPKTRHKALVVGMYVLAQSRRAGAGSALVQAAIEHCARRRDIFSMTLTVTQGNEDAIKLYRRMGFAEFGTEPFAILTAGGFRSKVHMWRRIESVGTPIPEADRS